MKKIEVAKKHFEIGEFLEAKNILLNLYKEDSFDIEVITLLMDTFYQLDQNEIEYNYEAFLDLYDRLNKIDNENEYLDIYENFYNDYINIINNNSDISNLCSDIYFKSIHNYQMNHCHDGFNGKRKANKRLSDIIFKELDLNMPKDCKFYRTQEITDFKAFSDGSIEIQYKFEGTSEDHLSHVSVGSSNFDVMYSTKGTDSYSTHTFMPNKKDVTTDEVISNLKKLEKVINDINKKDKVQSKIFKYLLRFILLLLVLLTIFLYTKSIVLGIVFTIITIFVFAMLSWYL